MLNLVVARRKYSEAASVGIGAFHVQCVRQ
jgi:hypothetical protein